mgnify:FL=1
MCGRYILFCDEEIHKMQTMIDAVNRRQKMRDRREIKANEVAPTDLAPVLVHEDGRLVACPMSWGFPRVNGKGVLINARAETAAERIMFRESLFKRRCIIPAVGFFEWRLEPGDRTKTKYHFTTPKSSIVYLAVLYKRFEADE